MTIRGIAQRLRRSMGSAAFAIAHGKAIVQATAAFEETIVRLRCVTSWTDEQAREVLSRAQVAGVSTDDLLHAAICHGQAGVDDLFLLARLTHPRQTYALSPDGGADVRSFRKTAHQLARLRRRGLVVSRRIRVDGAVVVVWQRADVEVSP